MNKNKTIKNLLGLGTIATVAAPITVVVSCSVASAPLPLTPDDTPVLKGAGFESYTAGVLKDKLKVDDEKSIPDNFLEQIHYQATFFAYEKEQIGSIDVQKNELKWNYYTRTKSIYASARSLLMRLKNTTPGVAEGFKDIELDFTKVDWATRDKWINRAKDIDFISGDHSSFPDSEAGRTAFDNIRSSIRTAIEERTKIEDNLKTLEENKVDYSAEDFSQKYSKLLKPLDKVKEDMSKQYDEAKAAFIETYSKAGDAEKAWIDEIAKRYNNAKNKDEAINFLANRQVESSSYGLYSLTINGDFTIEQLDATYKDGQRIFTWVDKSKLITSKSAENGGTPTDLSKEEHVYFLARATNILNRKQVNLEDALDASAPQEEKDFHNSFIQTLDGWDLMKVSHVLVSVTQDSTGSTLPWIQKAGSGDQNSGGDHNALRKLMSIYGSTNTKADSIWTNALADGKDDETDLFLKFFSGNSAGPAKKMGSLGIQSYTDYLSQMDPFFMFAITQFQANLKPDGTFDNTAGLETADALIEEIVTKLEGVRTTHNLTNQLAIDEWFNKATDDELKAEFGVIFRDAFNKHKQVMYPFDSTGGKDGKRFLVYTSFGIHIIKAVDYGNTADLRDELHKSLITITDKQSIAESDTNWDTNFSSLYDSSKILAAMLKDTKFKDYLNGIKNDASKKVVWDAWVDAKYVTNADDFELAKVVETLADKVIASDKLNKIINAIGSKIQANYIADVDKELRELTVEPEDLYADVFKLGGVL